MAINVGLRYRSIDDDWVVADGGIDGRDGWTTTYFYGCTMYNLILSKQECSDSVEVHDKQLSFYSEECY